MNLISMFKPFLELVAALREAGFPEAAALLVAVVAFAVTGLLVAGALSLTVRFLSHKDMVRAYRLLALAARSLTQAVLGDERNVDKIRALTLVGKVRNWFLVGVAAVYGSFFFVLGISVLALAIIRHASIPPEILSQGVFWSSCSIALSKLLIRDIKRLWPIP